LKDRKTTMLILVLILCISIPAALSENDNFGVDYVFEPVMINGQWMIKDTVVLEIPGEPLVPYRAAAILLPEGAELKDIKVKHGKPIVQKGFELPWGQPPCTFNDKPVIVGKTEKIYNSDSIYPHKLYEFVGIQSFRGFNILYVNLFPVQYQPKSQTVHFYEKLTVEVQFGKKMKHKLYRGLPGDKQTVAGTVDNPDVLAAYEDRPAPLQTEEYIIITNSTLQSTFQTLADHKANYVNGTNVYEVTWIYSNYSGVDNQEKIRNFIKDMYQTHGTQYCLLGGDISVVPYRGFYVTNGGYTDSDMAADMYFGCLDGTFNDDGDGRWAEPEDGVDWLMEVFVGRAPVETVAEAENFVNKVTTHEFAPRPEVCQYHAAGLGSPDTRQLAWDCEYWTPSTYVKKELFEHDQPVTTELWRSAWDGTFDGEPHTPPLMFQHFGGGAADGYFINSDVLWYISDVPSLTNSDFFPVHMGVSPYCGEFTVNDCLAEAYINDDCGAIACYMNDSLTWFSAQDASMYCGDFIESEFRALFSDGKEHLGELLNQAKSYWVSSAENDSTYRWSYYQINLLGDPETPVLTQRTPPEPDTVTITNPNDGEEVYGTVVITTSVTGCINAVEFYIDGEFKYADTKLPFEYVWDTWGYAEDKQHTILVKGYCSGELKDEDKVTVTVNNFYIQITNPKEGDTVSGIVTVTTDVRGYDTVEFYIDNELKYIDTAAPFQYEWDTKEYPDGNHTITARGYASGVFAEKDEVTCIVNNSGQCVGTVLVLLLVLFGAAGTRRH